MFAKRSFLNPCVFWSSIYHEPGSKVVLNVSKVAIDARSITLADALESRNRNDALLMSHSRMYYICMTT